MYPMARDHDGTDEGNSPEPQAVLDLMRLLSRFQDECPQAVLRLSLKEKTFWFLEGLRVITCLFVWFFFNKSLQPVRWKQPVIIKEISVIHFRLSSLNYNNSCKTVSLLCGILTVMVTGVDAQRSCSCTLPASHNQDIP